MKRLLLFSSSLLLVGLANWPLPSPAEAAPAAQVQELRTQQVGDVIYFHVRLEPPAGLLTDPGRFDRGWFAAPSPSLAPKLVSAKSEVRLVCQRFERNAARARFGVEEIPIEPVAPPKEPIKDKDAPEAPRQPVPVRGLEFVGRTDAKGAVVLKLIYPIEGKKLPVVGRLTHTPPPPVWKELDVTLDFGKATKVAAPKEAAQRREANGKNRAEPQPPVADDLEGLWAVAQVEQFADMDNEVREFGFYSFAATALARKYGVASPPQQAWRGWNPRNDRGRGEFIDHQLYETTTGAAAITESLQLRRMNPAFTRREDEKRTLPIAKVKGIDVAEHPWEKMIGDKKPAPEPFARLIPHDNYYVHFKSMARFLEFGDLLDQWGTNLTRAYEVTSRDYRLKQRYEQQLCLKSTVLGRTLGPLVIKGIAVTGSDLYLREGSDVALVFQVINKDVFLGAVEPFIADARKQFGDRLKESTSEHNSVKIESFVTPQREVSLHRASVDDFVLYANSLVGLHRLLDVQAGKSKRLAAALDFQYMRTIFRYDDKDEDGFAFLSDAFIRTLVGPASKIKERRRLEALVSLHMLTHAAMLTSWETGKPAASSDNILQGAGLKVEELPMSGGKPALWDAEARAARSDVYNTIHFATPLIELPIDQVTQTEADEYNRFRLEYLGLWRQYFDPIGMRVALKDGQVKLDTYILPLIENTSYNQLRRVTGEKSIQFDPSSLSDKTLFQYMMRLSTDVNEREAWFGGGRGNPDSARLLLMAAWALDPVGEWVLFRIDDSPAFERLLKSAERTERGEAVDVEEVARDVWSLPVAVGMDVRNSLTFTASLTALRTSAMKSLPGALTWEPLEKEYKGVSIVRVQATSAGRRMLGPIVPNERPNRKDPFLPAIYYAMIDGGFYLTLNEEMIKQLIDGATAKRDPKASVEVATSLYLAPGAAEKAGGLLKRYLEYQTHQQARTSLPIWQALYRSGMVAPDAPVEQAQAAAYRSLAFVPVSPDGSTYSFDTAHDEVVNERHGSFRKPILQKTTAENSPLNFLADQLRSVRADLRFREDGVHTVLTLERRKKEK